MGFDQDAPIPSVREYVYSDVKNLNVGSFDVIDYRAYPQHEDAPLSTLVRVRMFDTADNHIANMDINSQWINIERDNLEGKSESMRTDFKLAISQDEQAARNNELYDMVKITLENRDKPLYALGEYYENAHKHHVTTKEELQPDTISFSQRVEPRRPSDIEKYKERSPNTPSAA